MKDLRTKQPSNPWNQCTFFCLLSSCFWPWNTADPSSLAGWSSKAQPGHTAHLRLRYGTSHWCRRMTAIPTIPSEPEGSAKKLIGCMPDVSLRPATKTHGCQRDGDEDVNPVHYEAHSRQHPARVHRACGCNYCWERWHHHRLHLTGGNQRMAERIQTSPSANKTYWTQKRRNGSSSEDGGVVF